MSNLTLFETEATVALTSQEHEEFQRCETIIQQGLKTFYEVGSALATIRDNRLYRSQCTTFEQYCQERWGMSSSKARRLISSSEVTDNIKSVPIGTPVSKNSQALPENEAQVRPLTKLPPTTQREVWQEAVDTAPQGNVTGKHVESVVKQFQEQQSMPAKKTPPTFNATNDNIEWAKWTWNPVTGCLHGCGYCYARDIANRFTGHFNPEFHEERLTAPFHTKIPEKRKDEPGIHNVFVCSMADLFGEWVPIEWIQQTLDSIKRSPQWTYLFLTKNPERYLEKNIQFPDNCWVGATADTRQRMDTAIKVFSELEHEGRKPKVTFVSCEPLLEYIELEDSSRMDSTMVSFEFHEERVYWKDPHVSALDWIIIGGRSKTSNMEAGQPEWEWVKRLLVDANKYDIQVYFKPNLTVRPKEYPE